MLKKILSSLPRRVMIISMRWAEQGAVVTDPGQWVLETEFPRYDGHVTPQLIQHDIRSLRVCVKVELRIRRHVAFACDQN